MSIRGNHGKQNKSLVILKGFSLSFLFAAVFVIGYIFSADLIAQIIPEETGGFLAVWGPAALIALVCSTLCCLFFLVLKDKLVVPVAFFFLAVFYLIMLLALSFRDEASLGGIGLQFVSIYALPPALIGNMLSWGIYLLIRRKRIYFRSR